MRRELKVDISEFRYTCSFTKGILNTKSYLVSYTHAAHYISIKTTRCRLKRSTGHCQVKNRNQDSK